MKKLVSLLIPAVLLSVTPMPAGQLEHAPTAEQCRADADAWGIPRWSLLFQNQAAFNKLSMTTVHDENLSAKLLNERAQEFAQCEKTDHEQSGRYSLAGRAYLTAELERAADFMGRHGLTQQFYKEDEAGQR